mmetsp:Transcript_6013/g.5180  ORF Transcript_6013/g.5180 Transcript_6013/m.5180 type:complete len:88 (-) Transcript_6013:21-284(-)
MTDINYRIKKQGFLTGDEKTIADIHIYNEVINVAYHLGLDLQKYPNLYQWYTTMGDDEILQNLNKEMEQSFKDIIDMYVKVLEKSKN